MNQLFQEDEEPEPAVEETAFTPVVWVAPKQSFYLAYPRDFILAFQALCRWSSPEPLGPCWITPIFHEGLWKVSARHQMSGQNITAEATTPEGATIALAAILELAGTPFVTPSVPH